MHLAHMHESCMPMVHGSHIHPILGLSYIAQSFTGHPVCFMLQCTPGSSEQGLLWRTGTGTCNNVFLHTKYQLLCYTLMQMITTAPGQLASYAMPVSGNNLQGVPNQTHCSMTVSKAILRCADLDAICCSGDNHASSAQL